MQYRVDPRLVAGAAHEIINMLEGKKFPPVETIMGLSEVLGRLIVMVSNTPVQMDSLSDVVCEHVKRTIDAGAKAKGVSQGVQ